ncbi:MAG: FG-GAP-like repeat-containing protein [Limnochordia bacterium]
MIIWAVCICGSIVALGASGAKASYALIEVAQLTALSGVTDVAVGSLVPDGSLQRVAVVQDGRVLLHRLSPDGLEADVELEGFKYPAVSVAFADFDGDGQDDLWIGSAGPGIVYVYSLSEGYSILAQTDRYMWSPAVKLITADLDGDGLADVVALSEAGTAFAFLNGDSELSQVWRSGSREGHVRYLLACDLCGDGKDDVIVAREQGYISMWRWTTQLTDMVPPNPLEYGTGLVDISHLSVARREETQKESRPSGQFEMQWEEYPWGEIRFLDVFDVDQDGARELVIVTSQNLLYAYGCIPDGDMMLKASGVLQTSHDMRCALQPRQPTEPSVVLGVQDGALSVWQPRAADADWAFDVMWQSDFDVDFTQAVQAGKYLVLQSEEEIRVLERVPADYLKMVSGGKPYDDLRAKPVLVRGDILLSVGDWADLLGFSFSWRQSQRQITILWGMQYLVATVGGRAVVVNGRQATLSQEPQYRDGLVYLPAQLVRLLTPEVSWDPKSRFLSIR